jgi:tRNA pseudouridine55 synthase
MTKKQRKDWGYGRTEHGLLVAHKPSGMTSRSVVDRIARAIPRAKVGHSGTLDPLASGILIICVGGATRLVDAIQRLAKSYRTVIHLGARSDTLDADGRIEPALCPMIPSPAKIAGVLPSLSGRLLQQPPDYSALKINGRRAYDLARAGLPVELAPRLVQIDLIAVLSYEWPRLELQIDCASGTYIRSIARDLGDLLGCGGFVETLVRTRVGPFSLAEAVNIEALWNADSIRRHLRPAVEAVPDLPRVVLSLSQVDAVAMGRRLSITELGAPLELAGDVALLSEGGQLVALAQSNPSEGWVQPRKVFLVVEP